MATQFVHGALCRLPERGVRHVSSFPGQGAPAAWYLSAAPAVRGSWRTDLRRKDGE